ncbi:pepsin/retropepsin-like aspartic protease family protein [Kordiimonas aestuarii]|uniref:aspartyl protease family protein n=1 Tax=Kordiimonas aestuarii TaxID=1005925 RepID=UPI0021CEE1D8|nr:aspartyl protease family protein [Kordiimonas aestuarii]
MRSLAILLCCLLAFSASRAEGLAKSSPLASIPIDLSDNRIHATFRIGGVEQRLLLDTGASVSLLFESEGLNSHDLQLGPEARISFPAFATAATGRRLTGLVVTAGGFSFTSETTLYIRADESIIGDIGKKFSGILGRDFLTRFVVEVVPSEKIMKLYAPGTDLTAGYRVKHDLILEDGIPYLTQRFRLPWEQWPTTKKLLLDTGYPGGVVLWHDRHFERVTTAEEKSQLTAEDKGVVFFGLIRFSKLLYRNIPVFVGPSRDGQLDDRDGLIGASMFLPFRYVIDLSGERLLLEPRVKSGGIGYRISNEVIYTPGDEDFIIKDLRPRPSATPKDTYQKNNTEIVPE